MLAIVIPYYKITFFEETLQSLANQTDPRFKVYIGDDTSAENPAHLLEKYKAAFDFIYHRFEENFGSFSLAKHWERCIDLTADEEWIMVLGDDDVLGKNVVEAFYKQFSVFKDKTNVIRFATRVMDANGEYISNVFEQPIWEKASDAFYRKHIGKTRSSLSEYIFSREAYQKSGFYNYPLGWHSDDWAWLDFSDKKPIYTINDSLIFIRVSEQSISGKTDNEQLKNIAIYQFLKQLITKKLKLFNAEQQLKLLLNFEVFIKKKRKLSLKEWSFLFYLYLKVFKLVPFIKVIRRFFKNTYMKNLKDSN
ncbi:MAG: glycosyltransferase family A protein [Flavobacteriaceae bacterium]|nr:glycosyltransferase family A protein [Flavobacteriaceae bacterium]